ncbi:RHS repeat-associated core domain-containing protein [Pseudomonas sp. FP2309]|nr:RHS repeat-associated core domain-containing protein [Pseudomonas sp. FP2309]WLH66425.1 RHS repeat-associated core domain-containing protein [Pseudomonas sp. FP2309]
MNLAIGRLALTPMDVKKVDAEGVFRDFRECLNTFFDQESGLHYNRHRYYNPDIGRYLTQDPVTLAGGINAYLT